MAEDGKPGWICNTCRFEKKKSDDWVIEKPTSISRHSVISGNHYQVKVIPPDPLNKILNGRSPLLLMDIHEESQVNQPDVHLDQLPGPATGRTFNGDPASTGHNATDTRVNKQEQFGLTNK